VGRLPLDLSGILMSLFPPSTAPAGPRRAIEAADEADDFDEPTLPHALDVAAGDGSRQPEGRGAGLEANDPEPAAVPPQYRPWPAATPASPAAGIGPLPPLPVLPPLRTAHQAVGPQAGVPAHADIQAKVDDVVLSALISEFQGMRSARDQDA